MSETGSPLASYEAKWSAALPEIALGLRYLPAAERDPALAFHALVQELSQAAFGIRDAEPAVARLQWWSEEFAHAGAGGARHPLTRELAAHARFARVDLVLWNAAVAGAFAQRDPQPAPDFEALLQGYGRLYQPLAEAEALLFGRADASAIARAHALARALRETAMLDDSLRDGRLPLPLDLLARQRMTRGEIGQRSPRQAALLRDWLALLARRHADLRPSSPVHAAAAAADRWRARGAARAGDPLQRLRGSLGRLPLRAAWAAWQAGRRR